MKKEKKPRDGNAFTVGKRKKAIARASFRKGNGVVKINSMPLESMNNELLRLKIKEPLILMGDEWKKFDISVSVKGGGITGQAEACRQAIARGLSGLMGDRAKKVFLSYDRNLLVYDPRRRETRKPPRSSKGARRYKQRSKR